MILQRSHRSRETHGACAPLDLLDQGRTSTEAHTGSALVAFSPWGHPHRVLQWTPAPGGTNRG